MPLHLGINALFVQPGKVGGAEYMLKNLVNGLNAVRSPSDRLTLISRARWPVAGPQEGLSWIEETSQGRRFFLEWKSVRRTAGEADAILMPNYFTPPTRALRKTRIVTVIHDLQYLHFPHYFSLQKRLWLRAAHELTLRLADQVVVISHFVKDDVLAHYGARWEPTVQIIPNPISFDRFDSQPSDAEEALLSEATNDLQRRYILSVAAQFPHKNLESLIRAFAPLAQRKGFDDLRLILVGQLPEALFGTRGGADLRLLIRELGLEDRVTVTGHVSDALLGMLYRHATLFAFPSLFEGFGMPAVEALGFGLPVVTTRCGSLPEATLGLAHYVDDPHHIAEWTAVMTDILSRAEAYRPAPEDVAHVRDRYTPERIGQLYYDVLSNGLVS